MLNKFGSEIRFPLTTAFSLSAVVAAMVATAPSAQAQVPCVASPNGTPSGTCSQYFGAGAISPLLLNRLFFDYYGIAIPTNFFIALGQPGGKGSQPANPTGSPRNTSQQFNYCGTGSANGRAVYTGSPASSATSASCSYATAAAGGVATAGAAFPTNLAGVTPLFAGTDSPLSTADITNYTTNKLAGRGNPIQVPTVFGGIAAIYNGGVTLNGLNLTTSDLCGIFDSSIIDYSQLVGTTGLSGPIRVFVSGVPNISSTLTVFLTGYLASACPSVSGGSYYLTAALNIFPNVVQTFGFTFTTELGMPDLVATTTGGFGYAQASFGSPYADSAPRTTTPAPLIASLQNPVSGDFIFPTSTTVNRGLTGVSLTTNSTYPCLLTVTGLPFVPTSGTAYPIISTTYTLAYTRYQTTAEANAVKGLYNFILTNRSQPFPQANDQIAQGLGFSVLNNGTFNPTTVTNQLRGSARNCINTITSP